MKQHFCKLTTKGLQPIIVSLQTYSIKLTTTSQYILLHLVRFNWSQVLLTLRRLEFAHLISLWSSLQLKQVEEDAQKVKVWVEVLLLRDVRDQEELMVVLVVTLELILATTLNIVKTKHQKHLIKTLRVFTKDHLEQAE